MINDIDLWFEDECHFHVSAGENVPPLSGERCPPEAGEVVDETQISSDESCVAGWSNVMSVCV